MKKRLICLMIVIVMALGTVAAIPASAASTVTESEKNNDFDQANSVSAGNTIVGTISDFNDKDYFKIKVKQKGYIDLLFTNERDSSSNSDWRIFVYSDDTTDSKIYERNAYYSSKSTALPKVGVETGTYYIVIVDGSENSADNVHGVKYSIETKFTATDAYESEGNGSVEKADSLAIGKSVTGYISTVNDNDYFKFSVTARGYLEITVTNKRLEDSASDWEIYVYKDSNTIDSVFSENVYVDSISTALPKIGLDAGTYYIMVARTGSGYKVIDHEYTLSTKYTVTNNYEIENNNSIETSTPMECGEKFTGYLSWYMDSDYYKLDVKHAGYLEVVFSTQKTEKNSKEWNVYVYRDENTYNSVGRDVMSSYYATNCLEPISVTPGTYYIKVSHQSNTVDYIEYSIIAHNSSKLFSDVSAASWYKQYVDYTVTNGIFTGTSYTTFSPDTNITRAQFVQVLANLSGVNTANRNVRTKFADVLPGKWYTAAVKWANENGIVAGLSDTEFGPDSNITREQMCVMLVNYAKFRNIKWKTVESKINFADDAAISGWAKEAVYICQQADIVNGKGEGRFDPRGTGTRAEGATIFTKFHKDYLV